MKNQFTSPIYPVTRRTRLLGLVGLTCFAALAGVARDAPKLSISDRAVDRSLPGVSYANVLKQVTASVVTIESTRTIEVRQFHHPFLNDPMLRQFFGEDPDSNDDGLRKQREESLGSGVIVTEDGYILTNNHVVEGADEDGLKVTMPDGKVNYKAKVIGKDPRTDLAVLKIEAGQKLPALMLANSDKLEVGDVVLAVGNPFGIGQSVSSGIVSALGRGFGILGRQGYEDFIQTDASINQGNSGGALVDAEGRLIGINQSIASPSGANAGVGFAVPINLARSVMEQLITNGKISRGYLGVSLQAITPGLAEAFHLRNTSGALVGGVQPGTPAEKAGLLSGDVIVDFNGKEVADSAHLRIMVAQMPPKTPVTFKLLRDGKEKVVKVTLAELPDELLASSSNGEDSTGNHSEPRRNALAGVEIADLDRAARRSYGIPSRIRGVLVTEVAEDSAAAEAGLRPGDVIVGLNRKPVQNSEAVADLLSAADGKQILLRVYSAAGGFSGTRYLSVAPGKN